MTLFLLALTLYQPQGFQCLDVSKYIFDISISNLSQLADRRELMTTNEAQYR